MNLRTVLNTAIDWRTRRRASATAGRPGKRGLLLISSGGLGDTMLFSLVLPRFLALVGPDEPVCLLVRSESAGLRFLYPENIDLLPVNYRKFLRDPLYRHRICRSVFQRRFRIAVSTDHLRLPTVDDVLVMASGAEERLAMEPRSWPKHDAKLAGNRAWYTHWAAVSPGLAHRMVRWVDLANALTGRNDPLPVVRFADDRLPPATKLSSPAVVLHPFSALPERGPGVGLFEAVIDAVPEEVDIVLSAAPGDLDRRPEFGRLLDRPRVRLNIESLLDKTSLLRAASLVVSVDTSLMHLAAGAGAPTLCLASAAHVIDSVPYDARMTPDNVTFLYHDMPCRGCLGTCVHDLEGGVYPCVARLDPGIVTGKVRDLLTARRGDGVS